LDEKKGCVTMAEANKAKKDRGKWFREMRSELKKVVWPDGKTTAKNTGTVILCSLGVGVFIWVFDAVAVLAVNTLVGLFAA
jgi:preprotein translocase subunit SecE